jgi:hypothetical protein
MNKDEIIQFLKEDLSIEIDTRSDWDGRIESKLILKINDEEISRCYLPTVRDNN